MYLCQEKWKLAPRDIKATDLCDRRPFLFVSLVKVVYISLDFSLDNCTISVLGRPLSNIVIDTSAIIAVIVGDTMKKARLSQRHRVTHLSVPVPFPGKSEMFSR